ncbi:UNVERIFIED_CONTAM: hypothetical protein Sradi_2386100 [Sesamum radiatum]|uniref:Uncharacterized protein n=1 Tax=Sesamum radiatum TaxID=300843 RepID=A0AAW2T8G4_SESRA
MQARIANRFRVKEGAFASHNCGRSRLFATQAYTPSVGDRSQGPLGLPSEPTAPSPAPIKVATGDTGSTTRFQVYTPWTRSSDQALDSKGKEVTEGPRN